VQKLKKQRLKKVSKLILAISAAVLIPVAILLQMYFGGNWYTLFHSYSLGMFFGLIAWIFFCVTLLLSSRLSVLDRLFGQDQLIIMHRYTASYGLCAAMIHGIFKLQFFSDMTMQFVTGIWGYFIIFSLSLLSIAVMSKSIFDKHILVASVKKMVRAKIRYSKMKFIHNALPIALLVIMIHIIAAASTSENVFRELFILSTGVSVLYLWFFHEFIRPHMDRKGVVTKVTTESPSLFSVEFTLNKGVDCKAGQFGYFRFLVSPLKHEEHPFTIASIIDKTKCSLLVKKEGLWTHALAACHVGTPIAFDGAYGLFSFDEDTPMLWIAGGVGITPFLAKVRKMFLDGDRFLKPVTLVWSASFSSEMPFRVEFEHYAEIDHNFSFVPICTRDPSGKRITEYDISRLIKTNENAEREIPSVWLCGSESLRYTVKKGIKRVSLPKQKFHYENFTV
jgi:predicted ferric reductase